MLKNQYGTVGYYIKSLEGRRAVDSDGKEYTIQNIRLAEDPIIEPTLEKFGLTKIYFDAVYPNRRQNGLDISYIFKDRLLSQNQPLYTKQPFHIPIDEGCEALPFFRPDCEEKP